MRARQVGLHLILLGVGLVLTILVAVLKEPKFASVPLLFTALVMYVLSTELWRTSKLYSPEAMRRLRMLAIGTGVGAAIVVVIVLVTAPPVGR